jgi:hypothetical protein
LMVLLLPHSRLPPLETVTLPSMLCFTTCGDGSSVFSAAKRVRLGAALLLYSTAW